MMKFQNVPQKLFPLARLNYLKPQQGVEMEAPQKENSPVYNKHSNIV